MSADRVGVEPPKVAPLESEGKSALKNPPPRTQDADYPKAIKQVALMTEGAHISGSTCDTSSWAGRGAARISFGVKPFVPPRYLHEVRRVTLCTLGFFLL